MSSRFLSVKIVLISTGILSMAMGLKLTLPVISNFILSEAAPTLSTFFLTCFTPPYLYLLLNFIILTIVASSKLHNHNNSPPEEPPVIHAAAVQIPAPEPVKLSSIDYNEAEITPVKISGGFYNGVVSGGFAYEAKTTPVEISGGFQTDYSNGVVSGGYAYEAKTTPVKISGGYQTDYNGGYAYEAKTPLSEEAVTGGGSNGSGGFEKETVTGGEETLAPSLQRKESMDFAFHDENEKPPLSARFGHRKGVRASPEGGKVVALGVTKPKRQETLESTWRTITEGRAMPLNRHLKKSETMETQPRRNAAPLADLNGPSMKKSETFAGREKKKVAATSPGSGGGKLRKEPSLSQDELNRRVEAFINKFNTEMRLQRQESLRQYREMVNRGATKSN